MKRFVTKAALLAGVHLLLLGVLLVAYARRFPPAESYYAAMLDKLSLIETQTSPRLVLIGGSSMALGTDSAMVAEPNGFHPVNMGMNMAVGLELMLDSAEPFLQSGDVVIVAPEIYTFQTHRRAHPECLARLVECDPALLHSLPPRYIKRLLDGGYLPHLGSIARILSRLGPQETLWDGLMNTYNARGAFNVNGDIIAHHGVKPRRGGRLRFEFTQPREAQLAIQALNEFYHRCRKRGVRVFFSHAPYERATFDLYRRSIEQLDSMLHEQLVIPMLDTAEEMTFAREEIFDLEYHLNLAGKTRHSQMLAERLGKALVETPRLK